MFCTAVVLQALSVYFKFAREAEKMAKTAKTAKNSKRNGQRREHQGQYKLNIGCWNMRTLVEAEGSVAMGVARPGVRGVAVDRKAALMVHELKRFQMNITGISETKWFGNNVYNIEGYTIIHSGRPIPGNDERVERNEGVGIVLDPKMSIAWRSSGEVWKAVSSRIVSARLKFESNRGVTSPTYATIVSIYAPTHRAPQESKDIFYSDLQSTIDNNHKDDILLLIGDFNARVGSSDRVSGNRNWDGVRGYHGVGQMNESGEALLSFCALNGLTILNTYFEKKSIHKNTWQHPGSKKWHCIDYIIMRQRQRRMCCDVTVLRSADCWTDHKLLRAKLQLQITIYKKSYSAMRKRFSMAKLSDRNIRSEYDVRVNDEIKGKWNSADGAQRKWEVIRDSVTNTAEKVLGRERRKHPDWFLDNLPLLQQLIQK